MAQDNNAAMMISGRCYCGVTTVHGEKPPQIVTYCHCHDCRRLSGAPVSAFAAFGENDITFEPDEGQTVEVVQGARRSFCRQCGSSTIAHYDYAPGQVFVPIGILDQADQIAPVQHAHAGRCLSWLKIDDTAERIAESSRTQLAAARGKVQKPGDA